MMSERTFVVTGASDGIGAAAVRRLRRQFPGDRVVIVGRNLVKTQAVARECGVRFHVADFEDLVQVRRLAAELGDLSRIDGLANNAGGLFDGPVITRDGWERTWQVNVVAPFLLTSLLRPQLEAATVVQTASIANALMSWFRLDDPDSSRGFSSERAYGNAKLGDILMTRYFHAHGLRSVAFHPGVLATGFAQGTSGVLGRLYSGAIGKRFDSPDAGGRLLVRFLTEEVESGMYYNNKLSAGWQPPIARNPKVASRVFDDLSSQLGVSWG